MSKRVCASLYGAVRGVNYIAPRLDFFLIFAHAKNKEVSMNIEMEAAGIRQGVSFACPYCGRTLVNGKWALRVYPFDHVATIGLMVRCCRRWVAVPYLYDKLANAIMDGCAILFALTDGPNDFVYFYPKFVPDDAFAYRIATTA